MISEARDRVAVWVKQIQDASADKRTADGYADQQSLDRAADLEAIYQDGSWTEDAPPPPKPKGRGRKGKPGSRDHYAKWIQQTYGWGSSSQLDRLKTAHELLPILSPVGDGIRPTGERSLRPLAKLRKQGYVDDQAKVWARAVEIADGEPPTGNQVGRAVTEFLKAHQSPVQNLASMSAREKEIAQIKNLVANFDVFLAKNNRAAHIALRQMQEHFKAHQMDLRESA